MSKASLEGSGELLVSREYEGPGEWAASGQGPQASRPHCPLPSCSGSFTKTAALGDLSLNVLIFFYFEIILDSQHRLRSGVTSFSMEDPFLLHYFWSDPGFHIPLVVLSPQSPPTCDSPCLS